MNRKIALVILIIGFLFGRLTANDLSEKKDETKIVQITESKSEISQVQQTQKVSNLAKQTIVVEKHYSPKGKLSSEKTEYSNISENELQEDWISFSDQELNFSKVDKKEKIDESSKKNILVGFIYPASFNHKFQASELKGTISVRIMSDIYLTAGSDYKFSKPEVGLMIGL